MEKQNIKQNEIDKYTIPQCVSVTLDPDDETVEQRAERQGKFLKLPENIKDKLVSYQTSDKIRRIGNHYKLTFPQLASIARVVRSYYFSEVKLGEFPEVLAKDIGIDLTKAQEIAHYVIDKIIKQEVSPVKAIDDTIKMPLRQALEKYSGLKYQIIGTGSIDLDGKPYPIKMTIENWIKDYYNVVGGGNRDSLKRGSYLYKNKNAQKLNKTQREQLAFLLSALDRNEIVSIDASRQRVVFELDSPKKVSINDKRKNIKQVNRLKQGKPIKSVNDNLNNSRKSIKELRGISIKDFIVDDARDNIIRNENKEVLMETEGEQGVSYNQDGNWDLHSQTHQETNDNSSVQARSRGKNLLSRLLGKKDDKEPINEDRLQFSSSQKFPKDSI